MNNLGFYGGPSLTRPCLYLHACRARACLKTFNGFASMHRRLVDDFIDASVLQNLVPGASIPEGWNTAALCSNLFEMYQGLVRDDDFPNLGNVILKHKRLCDSVPKHCDGLQKKIARDLQQLVPNNWIRLHIRRFPALGIPSDFVPASDLSKYFKRISSNLPPQVRMIVLKTWSNSWASTERYHEDSILGCVFGCGGHDNLKHYLVCDVLWTLVIGISFPHIAYLCPCVPPILLPAYRACFHNADKMTIILLALAFKTYHAIKMDYRHLIDSAFLNHNFDEVLSTCIDLIKLFSLDFPSLHCGCRMAITKKNVTLPPPSLLFSRIIRNLNSCVQSSDIESTYIYIYIYI